MTGERVQHSQAQILTPSLPPPAAAGHSVASTCATQVFCSVMTAKSLNSRRLVNKVDTLSQSLRVVLYELEWRT